MVYIDTFSEVGGAGGSSFVSGCSLCDAVALYPNDSVEPTHQPNHYLGIIINLIKMFSRNDNFHMPLSDATETGHSVNGAIVMKYISEISNSCICSFVFKVPIYIFIYSLFLR